jgi:hypothetical protein
MHGVQVWKFSKSFNVRDLKAHLDIKPEQLGLPGEVMPSEQAPKPQSPQERSPEAPSAAPVKDSRGHRASLLVPGKQSPRYLHIQQVPTSCLHHPAL